ncbi:serine hydrolase domain-containing protein [Clostridium tertium]|uniref:serine hydrolase domain-containing protein n=1 Tax=Clostridium tertium TaxID=1559 RepID=UPI0024B389F8|nr:serine hydrolase domain-containing protein [Clostridium tertium]MDI9217655.1 beta-lactamase family protein [Clostridium tertium]
MFSYKDTMDKLIKDEVDSGNVVGANVLVIHNGNEMYHNTFGYADKENKIQMKRDTIFRMYSMTKPITAVATMILVERGEIDLWDPVSKYIPEFLNQVVYTSDGKLVPAKREVNIQDLLNMTSGIPYPDENHEPGRQMKKLFTGFIERRKRGDSPDTMEYIKAIAKVPLLFHPGEKWMYGLSADILGGIIEVVSGKKYGQFLKEELFNPLDMMDTGFFVPKAKLNRFAKNYRWNEEKENFLYLILVI